MVGKLGDMLRRTFSAIPSTRAKYCHRNLGIVPSIPSDCLRELCAFLQGSVRASGPMASIDGSRLEHFQVPINGAGSNSRRNTIQCIDSTMLPRKKDLFGCTRSNPNQGSVPTDLTLASDLAFVFNASWVRPECCVDPLRPPCGYYT